MKRVTLDNSTATATLKQHIYISKERKRRYTGEVYIGNISLCGKFGAANENEEYENLDVLQGEAKSNNFCKTCEKRMEKINKEFEP